MQDNDIEKLIKIFAKLPALGSRSARRIVLYLLQKKETELPVLIDALQNVAANIKKCPICGNFGVGEICPVCADDTRDSEMLCVVRDVADLWAMERGGLYHGRYHVLNGVLSALDGVTPDDLNIKTLFERLSGEHVKEVILALPATIDGQITTHYLLSRLKDFPLKVTTLAQGMPVGAELDYMDDGTIQLALSARKEI